jgi:hypothetical protein
MTAVIPPWSFLETTCRALAVRNLLQNRTCTLDMAGTHEQWIVKIHIYTDTCIYMCACRLPAKMMVNHLPLLVGWHCVQPIIQWHSIYKKNARGQPFQLDSLHCHLKMFDHNGRCKWMEPALSCHHGKRMEKGYLSQQLKKPAFVPTNHSTHGNSQSINQTSEAKPGTEMCFQPLFLRKWH